MKRLRMLSVVFALGAGQFAMTSCEELGLGAVGEVEL